MIVLPGVIGFGSSFTGGGIGSLSNYYYNSISVSIDPSTSFPQVLLALQAQSPISDITVPFGAASLTAAAIFAGGLTGASVQGSSSGGTIFSAVVNLGTNLGSSISWLTTLVATTASPMNYTTTITLPLTYGLASETGSVPSGAGRRF